jgi:hypothetical protein
VRVPLCFRAGRAVTGAAVALLVAALATSAFAAGTRRPTVHSFFTRDEGARIHFALNFCEQDLQSGKADTYAATFRMWSAKGKLLIKRQVPARLDKRCGNVDLLVNDRFPAGNYWANVAITNVTRQSFSRTKARPLVISAPR